MARIILLDAGLIGLLASAPHLPAVIEGKAWLEGHLGQNEVTIPDVAAYEVLRELIRLGATEKLIRLDDLRARLFSAEVTEDAWDKAAEFWALVRKAGKPTASPDALDADAILAGVAATIATPGDAVVIATTNVRHLARFPGIDARPWREVR